MISDILALGRDDPLEKIDYIFSNKNTILNFHDISNPRMQDESSQVISAFQEELRYFNELYEEVESVMQEFLSVVCILCASVCLKFRRIRIFYIHVLYE